MKFSRYTLALLQVTACAWLPVSSAIHVQNTIEIPAAYSLTANCFCLWIADEPMLFMIFRQPPAFPGRLQPSIIGRQGLNHRVRYGNGCCPLPHSHRKYLSYAIIFDNSTAKYPLLDFLRKEVIQPHLPIRLPCYDFTPVTGPAFGSSLLAVGPLTSGISDSHGVTGGVYKTRERIHRSILICDY